MATPRELFLEIKKGKFHPAYFFYGLEEYRLSEARKYLVSIFLPDKQGMVNYKKIDGKKTAIGDLIAELAALPMLGERQVFAVDNIQHYKPKQLNQIIKMLTPPDPNRIIIFSTPSSKTPKKTSTFFKTISANSRPVEFKKLTETETISFIRARLEKESVAIEPEAVKMFAALIAGNRGALEAELNKLIDYKGKGGIVTEKDIKEIVAGYEVFNMFQLADNIVNGKSSRVLKMIDGLYSDGIGPTVLASLLQQHFISLYLVKNDKKPVGNRGFLIPNFKRQAQNYSNKQLEQIVIEIAELDSELRLGKIKPETAFEMLVLNLISKR